MSTRTNVILRNAENRLVLYRHCDGYPAECGAALVEALRALPTHSEFSTLASRLLELRYEKQSYESEPKRVYEITEGLHGDIEWIYEIDTDTGLVRVASRPADWYRGEKAGFDSERWINSGRWLDMVEFVDLVNEDRRSINARMAAMPQYKDATRYPMLEAA